MKYRLDFSALITRLNGEEHESKESYGKALARSLESSQDPQGKALKMGIMAIDLYKTGVLELDEADYQDLKSFVEKNNQMVIFFKHGLLNILNNKVEVA